MDGPDGVRCLDTAWKGNRRQAGGAYSMDDAGSKQVAARARDWDEIIEVMRERRLPGYTRTAR
jgi:hypothetical protein